ncbi:hypothetical protein N9D40_00995 [bacterium]|nr:hypothetical protein [bacterium]
MSPLLRRLSATALTLAIVSSLLASASLGTYLYNTWLGKPAAVGQLEQMTESLDQVSTNLSDLVKTGSELEVNINGINSISRDLDQLVREVRSICQAVEIAGPDRKKSKTILGISTCFG